MLSQILHPLIKAIILSIVHLCAPFIRPYLGRYDAMVNSFGGGLAITYVFLVMLPELDLGHDQFGRLIYLIVLLGFVVVYGMEHLHESPMLKMSSYTSAIAYRALYNWLLVFGMPEAVFDSNVHLALVTFAISLHLVHVDYGLGVKFPQFDKNGRFVLAGAVILGWVCRVFFPIGSEAIVDGFTALLAGTVIYSVFKEELPEVKATSYRWFFAGIVTYAAVISAAEIIN